MSFKKFIEKLQGTGNDEYAEDKPITPSEALELNKKLLSKKFTQQLNILVATEINEATKSKRKYVLLHFTEMAEILKDLQIPVESVSKNNWFAVQNYYKKEWIVTVEHNRLELRPRRTFKNILKSIFKK